MRNAVTLTLALALAGCDARLLLVDSPATGEGEGEGQAVGEGEGEGLVDVCASGGPSPVKVLVLVDVSASMQFSDQPQSVLAAIRAQMEYFSTRPEALVSVMGFGASVFTEPLIAGAADPRFEPAATWVEPTFLALKDQEGDLEGALAAAQTLLLTDMLAVSAGDLKRTRYVVIVVTDGALSPVCCRDGDESLGTPDDPFGCAVEPFEEPVDPNAVFCEGAAEIALCDDPATLASFRDAWQGSVGGTGMPDFGDGVAGVLDGFIPTGDRNRVRSLENNVRAMRGLGAQFDTALDVSFVHVLDSTLPDDVKASFGFNDCRISARLDDLAFIGAGFSIRADGTGPNLFAIDTTPTCP